MAVGVVCFLGGRVLCSLANNCMDFVGDRLKTQFGCNEVLLHIMKE